MQHTMWHQELSHSQPEQNTKKKSYTPNANGIVIVYKRKILRISLKNMQRNKKLSAPLPTYEKRSGEK